MKKSTTLLAVLAAIWAFSALGFGLLFQSCTEAKQPPPPPSETQANAPAFYVDPIPNDHFCAAIAPVQKTSRAVTVNGRLWPNGSTLKIKLLGGTEQQRRYFTDAVLEWKKVVNLEFSYVTTGNADLRVSFVAGSGSWSYIGTDAKGIPQAQATINIGWSGADVCLHELGHMLGMAHEQSSPNSSICWNKDQVYKDLGGSPNFWSKQTVDFNVFQKLTPSEATATQFDQNSIMQYSVPGTWTCDGKGIPGGKTLSALDISYMSSVYPKQIQPPPATKTKVALEQWKRDTILKWLNAATPIQ